MKTLAVITVIGVLHLLRVACSIGGSIKEGLKIIRGGN